MPEVLLHRTLGLAFCLSASILEAQVTLELEPGPPGQEEVLPQADPQALPYTPLAHYPEPVASLAVSSSGLRLAVVAGDRIETWNPSSRTRCASANFEGRYPRELRYLPGDRRLLVAGQGLWAVNPLTLVVDRSFPWILPDVYITAFDVSRDGQTAVVGDEQGRLHRVDLRTGRETGVIQAHKGRIHGVRFYARVQKVASTGVDETLALWSGEHFRKLQSLKRPYPPDSTLAATRDAHWLAMGGLRVDLFDTLQEVEVPTLEAGHSGLEGGLVNSLAFSPDGAWLASGGCDRIINVWDTRSRRILGTFEGTGDQVQALTFSRDGKRLFSGDRDGTVAVWALEDMPQR